MVTSVAVQETSERYEQAVTTMPRTQLEKFSLQAANTMEELERENEQLKMDINDVQKIDIDVINGWRQWHQTVDEEREKWAEMATRLSTEKQILEQDYKKSVEVIESLLEVLSAIEATALEHSKQGTKTLDLRSGHKKIVKRVKEAVDKYAVIEEESEAYPSAEDSADEE